MRVQFFVTCLSDTFYPRAAVACFRLLEHFGCEVAFNPRQTCCGQPFRNNGFDEQARELARRMMDIFEGSNPVVTPSASCAAMVREQFPQLFIGDETMLERARQMASRTFEITEFLLDKLGFDPAMLPGHDPGSGCEPVTVHESCHQRALGRFGRTTALLERVPGLEVRPLADVEQCCGFGGTFAAKFHDLSGPMAGEKVGSIAATGAGTVISSDAGCTLNIAGKCEREGVAVRFRHIAELLAARLGLMDGEEDEVE